MMNDSVSRQAVKDWLAKWEGYIDVDIIARMQYRVVDIPSAQPERLTDDDFETIRIHLSAAKEKLGNQHRWKEAEEYQELIDRFMSFASAQPEIIYCKDCVHHIDGFFCRQANHHTSDKDHCASVFRAERREE